MDAEYFESVTGLKNYEGFKILLKNSLFANGGVDYFACTDDTIVFNTIMVLDASYPYLWPLLNQVGVLLSSNGDVLYKNLNSSKMVANLNHTGTTSNLIVGYDFKCVNLNEDCTIAIFDLF